MAGGGGMAGGAFPSYPEDAEQPEGACRVVCVCSGAHGVLALSHIVWHTVSVVFRGRGAARGCVPCGMRVLGGLVY